MTDWEPSELRAIAAWTLLQEGHWPGTDKEERWQELAKSTIRTVAENNYQDEGKPPLSEEQVETVRTHIAQAVITIDGQQFGAEV